MTVIAAYVDDEGRTAIACDTEVADDARMNVRTKLVRRGQAIIGVCGRGLWARYLDEEAPEVNTAADLPALADGWIAWMKARQPSGDAGEGWVSGALLVALPGAIYEIGSDGAILQPAEPYLAIGSGQQVARGALYVAHRRARLGHTDPCVDVVRGAVRAAIAHAHGCGGEAIVETPGDDGP